MGNPATPVRLEPGQKQERRLVEKEIHPYLIRLEAGEFAHIVAEQRGVDLALRLLSPQGALIASIDSPTGVRGAERVSEVATVSGDFQVEVAGGDGTPPGTYEIRIEEQHAATEAEHLRVRGERVFQEGEERRRTGKHREAIEVYEQALAHWREAGYLRGQATALLSIGWMQEVLDEWETGAEACVSAAQLFQEVGDSMGQANALNCQGLLLNRLGRRLEASPRLEEAVRLFRSDGDPEGEVDALANLGNIYNWEGRFEPAVEAYDRVLALQRQLGNQIGEGSTLLSLGHLYLEHGKLDVAHEYFETSLGIAEKIQDKRLMAAALDGLGRAEYREERFQEARERTEQALLLYRELDRRRNQAIALNSLGLTLLKLGRRDEAQARLQEALALHRAIKDAQGEAMVTSHLGRVALARGEGHKALELGREALSRFEKLNDQQGISLAHYGIAQALFRLGEPAEALAEIEVSLKLAEIQRIGTESLDVRAFYFSSRQHYWELYIDLLMTLDRLHPDQGFAARALEADEERRARSLLDALAEERAELRQNADPALLREEEEILSRLDRARQAEVDDLLVQLDRVRTRMRRASPRLAQIEGPEPLRLQEIQQRLLDTNTLLLVYSLGEERSVLWRVTRSTLKAYPLPGRETIESAARGAHRVLSRRLQPGSTLRQKAVEHLSDLVLKPVAADLPRFRRLVIIPDGALQLVPFGALPDPGASSVGGRQPLVIEGHPVIVLPSATVGAALRQDRRTAPFRQSQSPLIAVLAHPVFDRSDPRLGQEGADRSPEPGSIPPDLVRSIRDLGLPRLEPLPASEQEAEAIQRLWPPGAVITVSGFAATREVLEDARWRRAPILHFATHSLLDDRRPELSGLVFSLVGPDGNPRPNAFLRLSEIYRLDLEADLVVLSACQTGVGKELRGEGLLGLTRGFMAIGVPQLVVSLWKVEDQATAELMSRFYREFFDGYRPPEALQRAQHSMLRDPDWSDPSLWAGFIFLGDFERRPGGDIETRYTGGSDPATRTDSGGLPPPKVRRPKPKPPQG